MRVLAVVLAVLTIGVTLVQVRKSGQAVAEAETRTGGGAAGEPMHNSASIHGFLSAVVVAVLLITALSLAVGSEKQGRALTAFSSLPPSVTVGPPSSVAVSALPANPQPVAELSSATATPTATAAAPPIQPDELDGAPLQPDAPVATPAGQAVTRLMLPRLGIDAPIVGLGVLPDGTMDAPSTPTDVGWYTFSARPGQGSNVVMGGHVDYANYGAAVFYELRNALSGDEVLLHLADGSTAYYRVLNVTLYEEATAPVDFIVGPTDDEVLTLITCGGSFDSRVGEYDKRVVVRAERMVEVAESR